jgi:hypothetical protein
MRALITGSTYGRIRKCPASAVLPHVKSDSDAARIGSAIHDHLARRVPNGYPPEVLAVTVDRYGLTGESREEFVRRCTEFDWCPPEGAVAEKSLALVASHDIPSHPSVIDIDGGKGSYDYDGPGTLIAAATIDLHWTGKDGALHVLDYKTGRQDNVDPVEDNAQMLLSSVLLGIRNAAFSSTLTVVPHVVFVGHGEGTWDTPLEPLAYPAITEAYAEISAVYDRVIQSKLALEVNETPECVEGSHCQYCPCAHACPARVALVKRVVSDYVEGAGIGALTPVQRMRAAELLPKIKRFVDELDRSLRDAVEADGPIALPDGSSLGFYTRTERTINPTIAVKCLSACGVDEWHAASAVKQSVSQSAIADALKAVDSSATLAGVLKDIDRLGGITTKNKRLFGVQKGQSWNTRTTSSS